MDGMEKAGGIVTSLKTQQCSLVTKSLWYITMFCFHPEKMKRLTRLCVYKTAYFKTPNGTIRTKIANSILFEMTLFLLIISTAVEWNH